MLGEANRPPGATPPRVDPDDLAAMLGGWAASGHGALPRRLAHALRRVVESGAAPGGWRLPPERSLATHLAVSRTTVTQALDELRSEGLLTSIQGSGTYVTGPASATPFGTRVVDHLSPAAGIDLAKGDTPDLSHLPPVKIEMWQLNKLCGGAGIDSAGLMSMRQAIADFYTRGSPAGRPVPTEPDQIQVTAGSHQANSLLVSTLAARGDTIALAEFGYPGIFDIFDRCEVRAVPVRLDHNGMVPQSLDEVLRRHRPTALFVQAGAQIPTGQVASATRISELAAIVDRHGVTVIEDTTLAGLSFRSGPTPTLTGRCRRATVVTTGSLSKTCWSGLRVGWIRGPLTVIDQTRYRNLGFDLGPSAPSQLMAVELMPQLDEIIARRRGLLQAAVETALDHLTTCIPEVAVTPPGGGSILWAEFPLRDSTDLVNVARRHAVRVAAGSIHTADKAPGPFVRIDVDRPAGVVEEGIVRLARAWRELQGAH